MKGDKKKKKTFLGRLKTFLCVVTVTLATLLLLFAVGCWCAWMKWGSEVQGLVQKANQKIESIDKGTFNSRMETTIYDKNNVEIARLAEHDYQYVSIRDLNPNISKAFVAIEDRNFYSHHGVDPKALLRAGVAYVKNKGEITQGGSTITQQLVKNVLLTNEQSFKRKFEEIVIAYQLEKTYSKDQVMEFYVNNINYSNATYSIETASQFYFGKSNKELSLAEVAYLVSIPNNPSFYNPLKHPDHVMDRQYRILEQMKDQQLITDEEYTQAVNEKVELHVTKRERENESYAVSYAIDSATKAIMEQQGFTFEYDFASDDDRKVYEEKRDTVYEEVNHDIRDGGYIIYTSLDMEKQAIVQKAVDHGLEQFHHTNDDTGRYNMQGAAVVVDNTTSNVVAIVGGRTQEGVIDWFNRGYQAYRQPGSSIKPLVVYTPAFERGMLASTTVEDKYIKKGPANAQGRYYGSVPIRYATELSLNTVAYQLVDKFTPNAMLDYLKEMKFTDIVDEDKYPGIGIGGFTYGVTPLEMAGGFSTLARNGIYIEPSAVLKIFNESGETIYQNKHKETRVYDSGSTYVMTDVLQGVLKKSYASGYGLAVPNMPSAGKTGTTNDSKDGWFSGYTPYYTASVWVGTDIPSSVDKLYGASYPGHIWNDFMTQIHDGLDSKEFTVPDDVHEMYVNESSKKVSMERHRGWEKEWVPDTYLKMYPDRLTDN